MYAPKDKTVAEIGQFGITRESVYRYVKGKEAA